MDKNQTWQSRHGDVMIESVATIPVEATICNDGILAHGETTGHAHRIAAPENATLWELNGVLYMKVVAETQVVHEEHKALSVPAGLYRVWQQREYSPEAIRRVMD